MKKMPKIYEGVILRETDRTDTMGLLQKLASKFKLETRDKVQQVDKELEPLIKAVIQNDAAPNISSYKTIDQLKKAQAELIKARKNISSQQQQFGNGIKTLESIKDIAAKNSQSPEKWLSSLAQQSIKGDGSILIDDVDKQRYNGTFSKQSSQLLAVIMGYSSGSSWANGAIADVKTADVKYVENKTAGSDLTSELRDIESSVRVFTAMTGEMFDRIKKAQVAVEEHGQNI